MGHTYSLLEVGLIEGSRNGRLTRVQYLWSPYGQGGGEHEYCVHEELGSLNISGMVRLDLEVSKEQRLAAGMCAAAIWLHGDKDGVNLRQSPGIIRF